MKFFKDLFRFITLILSNTKLGKIGIVIFPENFRKELRWKGTAIVISTLGTWFVLIKNPDQVKNVFGDLIQSIVSMLSEEYASALLQNLSPHISHPENMLGISVFLQTPLVFLLLLHSLRPGCTREEVAKTLVSLFFIIPTGMLGIGFIVLLSWLCDIFLLQYLLNKLFFHSHWATLLVLGEALQKTSPFAFTYRISIIMYVMAVLFRLYISKPGYYEFDCNKDIDYGRLLLLELDVKTYFYGKRISQIVTYGVGILFYLDMIYAGFNVYVSVIAAIVVFLAAALLLARVSIKWIN